jgi:hypothetical protein
MGSRAGLVTFISLVLALGTSSVASAATFCVNDPACVAAGGTESTSLQAALASADANGMGKDTIEVGPGTYSNGPGFTADSTNPVDLIGEGVEATTLTRTDTTDAGRILVMDHSQSTVSDLTVQLNQGLNLAGLETAGSATRVAVTDPTGETQHIGVILEAAGASLRDSSVTLSVAPSSNTAAVGANFPTGTTPMQLENLQLSAGTGISASDSVEARRVGMTVANQGVLMLGAITLDQVSIRVTGTPATGLSDVSGPGPGGLPADLTARHVTVVGPGSGTGVSLAANCVDVPPTPRPAEATLRNVIVRGFETDLSRSAGVCPPTPPDPLPPPPAPATIDIAYSIFDAAKTMEFGPPGAGSINQGPGNMNVDPLFVDEAGGNLHLQQGSPAIDAGDPAVPGAGELTVDLDGTPRVQDGDGNGSEIRDIGAFEHVLVPDVEAAGPSEFSRKLKIDYVPRSEKFKGKLRSDEQACLDGKVKVFEKRKGKDPKVGADETNAAGKWSFEEEVEDGKFYAKVPVTLVAAGTCLAAKSKLEKVAERSRRPPLR